MTRHTRLGVSVAIALFVTLPAFAGDLSPPAGPIAPTAKPLSEVEPRTAVNADNTPGDASASFVIAQPGSYYLTGNIDADAAKDAIHISTDNVTLDLNGFTLDGAGASGPSTAISITDAYIGIRVFNGNIINWLDEGILGEDAAELDIRGVRFADLGGYGVLAGAVHCRDCSFNRCDGAFAASSGSMLDGARIVDCTGTTVSLGSGSVVQGCTIRGAGTFGIRLSGDDGLIEGNTIVGGSNIGISVANGAGTMVRDNSVTGCSVGLSASGASGNTFSDNISENNIVNYLFDPGNTLRLILTEIPQTISWAAHVTLGGDLTGSAGQDGITVEAEDVVIDLAGHALIGVPGSLNGIRDTGNPGGITVRNGVVREWGSRGIELSGTSGCSYESVHLTNNTGSGISSGSSATIQGCTARDNGIFGFIVGNNCVVTDCTASNNGAQGINTGLGCSVIRCTAYVNGQQGIQTAFGSTIAHCTTNNNLLNGIVTSPGCTIVDCSTLDNDIYGISTGQGCIVDRCISGRNGSGGIYVSDGCIIRNNTCFDHPTGPGIQVVVNNDSARIEANHCYLNDVGINCQTTGCFIARNTCSNNTTNWDVAAGNVCLVVNATPVAVGFSGDSGGVAPGSTDPNANFSH